MPGQAIPPPCSFLQVGQAFTGIQNVSNSQKEEAWKVNVRLQGCDIQHGYLCGSMEALNVPSAETPVVTFWEGQIVDNRNYTFFTGQWDASPDTDVKHWSKFSSFLPLSDTVERDGGRSLDLATYPSIFMRWKEKFFVNVGADCGLTIAGFYYVCFSRNNGAVQGFYYDPNSRFLSKSTVF
ncbi:glucose-induced degradation protein 4 homolog isoform X2 [Selaginella moellendorffii]|uniref:glucose-induced degradation protein 4 homolog isoform X2 n=1 Tax=Selaginella moellendorffii TaxID=88036 RepID=UPI000D1CB6EE|nr:glucose-induced degradation protein 4 homolog isoform X2 [Selaginella moellendorffii]|eukprot:XP_024525079.1 glucose-induced degradation protein 4 homolog isoform X2 [Selaginella moellendorffii]